MIVKIGKSILRQIFTRLKTKNSELPEGIFYDGVLVGGEMHSPVQIEYNFIEDDHTNIKYFTNYINKFGVSKTDKHSLDFHWVTYGNYVITNYAGEVVGGTLTLREAIPDIDTRNDSSLRAGYTEPRDFPYNKNRILDWSRYASDDGNDYTELENTRIFQWRYNIIKMEVETRIKQFASEAARAGLKRPA